MKTILVPTDFSETAENALLAAIGIAREQHAAIVLINTWEIPLPATDIPFPAQYLDEEIRTAQTISTEKLIQLVTKVKAAGIKQCEAVSRRGNMVTIITETAESTNADMIVMGTNGSKGLKSILISSNTVKIIRKASCPVLVVPVDAIYKGFERIVYLTQYQHSDFGILKKIAGLAKIFDAEITLVHFTFEQQSHQGAQLLMEAFTQKVKDKIHYDNLSFKVLYGEDPEEKLLEYVEHKHADLLVTSTHYRDLFDRLFGNSVSELVAYRSAMPVLVFHHQDTQVLF